MCMETEKSLKMPSFLKIGEETLTRFLQMEKMNISSELWLIRACLQYAKANDDERKQIFRRTCLPHLRLLTLKVSELSEVSSYLTSEEKACLAQYQSPLMAGEKLVLVPTLCPITTQRNSQEQAQEAKDCALIPDHEILDLKTVFENGGFCRLTGKNKFFLTFSTTTGLRITGLDILCKLDIRADNLQNDNLMTRVSEGRTSFSYENNMQVRVRVESNGLNSNVQAVRFGKLLTNSLVHVDLPILNVPGGSRFSVQVIMDGDVCIRKVRQRRSLWNIPNSFPYAGERIEMKQLHFYAGNDKFVTSIDDFSIFKNIHYTRM